MYTGFGPLFSAGKSYTGCVSAILNTWARILERLLSSNLNNQLII